MFLQQSGEHREMAPNGYFLFWFNIKHEGELHTLLLLTSVASLEKMKDDVP